MAKAQFVLPYTFYPKGEGLSPEDFDLIEQAKAATQTSYAPYSNFCVGAALRLDNGVVVCGSNQENAAYPAGCCAERTAMFYANSQYPYCSCDHCNCCAPSKRRRFLDSAN